MRTNGLNRTIDTTRAAPGERVALETKLARLQKDAFDLQKAAAALTKQISADKRSGKAPVALSEARERMFVKANFFKKEKLDIERQLYNLAKK